MGMLDRLVIGTQIRMRRAQEEFKEFMTSERGVSNVVATIIILLIVVLIIAIFWERLQKWLKDLMDQIFDESYGNEILSGTAGTEP